MLLIGDITGLYCLLVSTCMEQHHILPGIIFMGEKLKSGNLNAFIVYHVGKYSFDSTFDRSKGS